MRSAARTARSAAANGPRGIGSPNEIVVGFRMPPHATQAGSGSPASTRSWTRVRGACISQPRQRTPCALPCSSITRAASWPAVRCSPSMFCVTTAVNWPRRSSSTSARWAPFGLAAATTGYVCIPRRQVSRRASASARKSAYWIGWFLSQTPPGLRKSGIPDSVLIPAPVNATMRRAAANSTASRRTADSGCSVSIITIEDTPSWRQGCPIPFTHVGPITVKYGAYNRGDVRG